MKQLKKLLLNSGITISTVISPSLLAVFLAAIVAGIALFIQPLIGIADNGDFLRMLYSNGLYQLPKYSDQYFSYFIKEYGIMHYYNEHGASLFSSEPLFIHLAVVLNKLFYSQTIFDIRFLSFIYYVLFLGSIYLLTEALTYRIKGWKGYFIALFVVIIFTDTAYIAYFNSLYSEPIMFIMCLYIVSSTLLMCRKLYNDSVLLVLLTVSSMLLITSKQQNAPLVVFIAFIYIGLLFIKKTVISRMMVVFSLVLVLVTGVATYKLITSEFNKINQFQSMTRGVLLESENPEATLSDGGISEQFALLKENIYFQEYTAIDVNSPYMVENFYEKYGFGWILKNYLAHPKEFYDILDVAAHDIHEVQTVEMGNYEKKVGKKAKSQATYFTLYSRLKRTVYPKTLGFLIIWTLVYLALYFPSTYRAYQQNNPRGLLRYWLILASIGMIFGILLISVVGDGDADLAKHLFLIAVLFDFLTIMTLSDILFNRLWQQETEFDSLKLK